MNGSECSYAGYNLYIKSLDELPRLPKMVINTINQYSFCLAEKSTEFKKALLASEVLLPDGVGIVAAVRLQTGKKIKKISGSDIHGFMLKKLNEAHGKCFYLGASAATLKKIQTRLATEYPNIQVAYYSPPFKSTFSVEDNTKMIEAINKFLPDVLFVGMTAPKQEEWAIEHKAGLNVKVICSIGAVFDFYAGTKKRPNKIWIGMGLEWFGRLIDEPKRMWKRYVYYGPVFAFALLKYKCKQYAGSLKTIKLDNVINKFDNCL